MNGPLIVQSDKTVLLEVDHAQAAEARAALAPFAELERAPEHVHTYRITPLALKRREEKHKELSFSQLDGDDEEGERFEDTLSVFLKIVRT